MDEDSQGLEGLENLHLDRTDSRVEPFEAEVAGRPEIVLDSLPENAEGRVMICL